ncbi:hypothetical protein [Geobacter sp. FeAm09]|uniref:hypothetical protein n=1 Tax=Geobacter sp. FeAm09 TaxID=2597769 RepID=UPI00197A9AE6|nr:hypothetical protein [Geobacter sp. FeAm09]
MPTVIFADSPPQWCTKYAIESANKRFVAEVGPKEVGPKDKPWKWKYKITVRDNTNKADILWTQEYHHTGYSSGMLSNDGMFFVYVETWYYPLGNLITVYSKNKIRNFNAFNLSVYPIDLPRSVSHRLWLDYNKPEQFIEKNGRIIGLVLETYKGRREIKF